MITVKLMGGLGNQMFQYATAKALAVRRNTDVLLDLSFFEQDAGDTHTRRDFALAVFATSFSFAPRQNESFLKRLFSAIGLGASKKYIERQAGFDPAVMDLGPNCVLEGFWQTEKYFDQQRALIRGEFEFNEDVKRAAAEWKPSVVSRNSVSMHIRRGDYVSNKVANNFHGTLENSYYIRALKKIASKTESPEVFVFSDDPDWCRANLQLDVPAHFVSIGNAAAEMYLMTQCRHNIIANSSFSWWGAWLNENPGKLVVAPIDWYKDKRFNNEDIFAKGWIRL